MDKAYILDLCNRLEFPSEAVAVLENDIVLLQQHLGGFDLAKKAYEQSDFSYAVLEPLIEALSNDSGVHVYSLMMLMMLDCCKEAETKYVRWAEEVGYTDSDLFLDTFADLRYKLLECRYVKGVWGTFVAGWYSIFFRRKIVKLGRLEYEIISYPYDTPYVKATGVRKGDTVYNIHIPSSKEPFDREAQLDSFKKCFRFFAKSDSDPLVMVCHSWLLYLPYMKNGWPEGSHIRDFVNNFDVIHVENSEQFGDEWRVFGPYAGKSPDKLPDDSGLRRSMRRYMMGGGTHGDGFGVSVFDGTKILNQ